MIVSESDSGIKRVFAIAGVIAACYTAAAPALAESDLTSVHNIIEPVCRNVELSGEHKINALINQGWVQKSESPLFEYLAMGRTVQLLAYGQIEPSEQQEYFDAGAEIIPINLARDFGSTRNAARWFENENSPYLGVMLSGFGSSMMRVSECSFVFSGFDQPKLDALTALFPLSRPRNDLFGTVYSNTESSVIAESQINLTQSLTILKTSPIPVAILTINVQSIP